MPRKAKPDDPDWIDLSARQKRQIRRHVRAAHAAKPEDRPMPDGDRMAPYGFRVDSVDQTIDELKRRGVTIVAEPRDVVAMVLRVAFFADPWGNMFEIVQALSD